MITTAHADIIVLTGEGVECVVNPANAELAEGGTLCGDIYHHAGSKALNQYLQGVEGIAEGSAITTSGHKLCPWIIHTLSPRHDSTDKWNKLANCYKSIHQLSINLCRSHGVNTVAIPAIGTGAFGLDKDKADEIAYETLMKCDRSNVFVEFILVFSEEVRHQKMFDRGVDPYYADDDINYEELRRAEGGYGE